MVSDEKDARVHIQLYRLPHHSTKNALSLIRFNTHQSLNASDTPGFELAVLLHQSSVKVLDRGWPCRVRAQYH
ncbi:hypothetical protein TNCV_2155641 [Trichonephila clavipes]|nr:hypothetical protein TNCV_2155641 [Trichonephila clavipes]